MRILRKPMRMGPRAVPRTLYFDVDAAVVDQDRLRQERLERRLQVRFTPDPWARALGEGA